jgi:hypothetical protein
MPFKRSQERIQRNISWFLAHSRPAKCSGHFRKRACRSPRIADVVEVFIHKKLSTEKAAKAAFASIITEIILIIP